MNIGKLLLGLGLSGVFIVAAMAVGIVLNAWLGVDDRIVWFVFGGCYFNVAQKIGL